MQRNPLRRHARLLGALLPLALAACGGSSDSATPSTAGVYPTAPDVNEGASGNGSVATATATTVGSSQDVTLFPQGDRDFYAVDLAAGTQYEFSANHLSVNSDTYMYLYAADGTTQLGSSDDYIDLDSRILYTPSVAGTYYVMMRAYSATYGIAAYTLNVHPFVDADGDGYSAHYDCNDGDASVLPEWGAEIAGDGIDQDCNGTDDLATTTADAGEPDETPAQAREVTLAATDPWEVQFTGGFYAPGKRTIDDAADVDWFKVTVPAHGLYVSESSVPTYSAAVTLELYDSDATTLLDSTDYQGLNIPNDTAAAKTFYLKFLAAGATTSAFYVPAIVDYGVDADADGYYTRDWDNSRDCNDADATVYPGAADTASDGIDQDCDGIDG
jgi:hypothetical protein